MCPWQWNGGWPLHLTRDSPRDEIECPTLDTDHHHLRHLRSRTYMAAVSPWFFTVGPAFLDPVTVPHFPLHYQHYGPDSWNKNVGYRILFITLGYISISGFIVVTTGYLYGGGSTYSLTDMPSILYKLSLGMVRFLR
jgi:hypothetical protein